MGTILVTGASSSIGRPLTQRLIKQGYTVLAHFRHCHDDLLELKKCQGERLHLIPTDFESVVDLDNLCKNLLNFPSLFAIIHLPSPKISLKPLIRVNWEEHEAHLNVQLRSLQRIVQTTAAGMKKSKCGCIISVSSDAIIGSDTPKGFTAYAVAKAALAQFMRCLNAEYRDTGVRVHQIVPKMFMSPLLEDIPNYVTEQVLAQQNTLGSISYQEKIVSLISDLLKNQTIADHELNI